jgi:ADP-ribosylglycohydrolase
MAISIADRASGAVMGGLIGDALGVGPHWYYDLEEMRRDYGDWISDYTEPKADRYHAGLKAGQLSQPGIILTMLLRSVVENRDYVESDFCRRLDEELFPRLDGTPMNGPGGYTSQSIREAWRRRVEERKSWKETGGHADTTEAAERALVLAARYAKVPSKVAKTVSSNCILTQVDEAIVAMTTAYCCVLALLVSGESLDVSLSDKLMDLVDDGSLPFHAVTSGRLSPPKQGTGAFPRRPVLFPRRPPHPFLHGRGGFGSRNQNRACLEGVDCLRNALRDLSPAPDLLLSGGALPR